MPRRLAAALCALALGATRAAAAPDTAATAPTAPTAPVTSAAATDPAAMVDEVIAEVARLRGLARLRPIARAVVGPDDLASVADASAARVADDALGFAAARWGLVGQADAYGAVRGAVLRAQLVGFYDRVAKRLYVGADDGDPLARRLLLAHEIDHALVDQHFGLGKLLDAKGLDGDAALARQALVEGDAMAVMAEVVLAQVGAPAPWTDPEAAATLDHTLATGGPASAALGSAPPWLRDRMLFPYRAGLAFVAGIRRHRAWTAVDAAFRRPPRSTEQLLHADAYDADARPIAVAIATPPSLAGWRAVYSDVWGEAGWLALLRAHGVAPSPAATAAAGWGGDRVAVFAREGEPDPRRAVAIAVTTWDDEVDAIEAAEALVRALDAFAGTAIAREAERGRWLDGARLSWVERRGAHVIVVIGAPLITADALATEVWRAATVDKQRLAK